jgi:hypothetical protein
MTGKAKVESRKEFPAIINEFVWYICSTFALKKAQKEFLFIPFVLM